MGGERGKGGRARRGDDYGALRDVGPAYFPFLWIAANELPLVDELIPFLIAVVMVISVTTEWTFG